MVETKPKGFHLEIWQWAIIVLLVGGILFLYWDSLSTPSITATSNGYHLYYPQHDGISFDYSSQWGLAFASKGELLSWIWNSPDMIVLEKINSASPPLFMFFSDQKSANYFDSKLCTITAIEEKARLVNNLNLSLNSANWVKWGNVEGCLTTELRNNESVVSYDFSGHCSSDKTFIAFSTYCEADMKEILSTIRCGPDAIK